MNLLQNIDVKETQKSIERVLRQYRTYYLTAPEEMLPSLTPKYTLELPVNTGMVNSKTENAALKNAEFQKQASKFFDRFNRAFRKLTYKEREVIAKACLEEEPRFNYEIADELNLSERTFYRIKSQAMYKLALAMHVVVYEEDTQKKEGAK